MSWQEFKKQFKLLDGIIIGLLILLSFLPHALFAINQQSSAFSSKETTAIITIDGKEVGRFSLSEKTPHQEKKYRRKKKQYNIVEVDGKNIRVKEDNSPDQIAVNTGWINKPGETSICLPHRLIIEIKGVSSDDEDDIIISH